MARLVRVSPVGVLLTALGSERFTAQIEALTDSRVTPRNAGQPKMIIENAD
jgi:hypothetical protein